MLNKMKTWLTTGLGLGIAVSAILISGSLITYSAISQVVGLAVAQGSTWQNVRDASAGDNLTNGIFASGIMIFDGTNFDRARGDVVNGLDVDVTRVQGTVTVAGNKTPGDGAANPIDAITTDGRTSLFNGTTWDRARSARIDAPFEAMTTGVVASGVYAYDLTGTSLNRYKAITTLGGGSLRITEADASLNITTNTDTLIDAGVNPSIILHKIVVGVGGTASQVVVRSESDGAIPCGGTVIGTFSTVNPILFILDGFYSTDLCFTTTGTTAANLIILTELDIE